MVPIETFPGDVLANSYIVMLKAGVALPPFLHLLGDAVTHSDWHPSVLNGFAGIFTAAQLAILQLDPGVDHICEDGMVSTMSINTQ